MMGGPWRSVPDLLYDSYASGELQRGFLSDPGLLGHSGTLDRHSSPLPPPLSPPPPQQPEYHHHHHHHHHHLPRRHQHQQQQQQQQQKHHQYRHPRAQRAWSCRVADLGPPGGGVSEQSAPSAPCPPAGPGYVSSALQGQSGTGNGTSFGLANNPDPTRLTSGDDKVCMGLLGAVCGPCLACSMARQLGESCCVVACVPGGMYAMRTKLRMQQNIEGSICEDCLTLTCCCPFALCQMARELDNSEIGRLR